MSVRTGGYAIVAAAERDTSTGGTTTREWNARLLIQESDGSEAPSPFDLSATDDDLESVQWLQSKGKQGHLHLLGPIVNGRMTTRCGRRLHGAMPGHGMEEAVGTGAPWSPRCLCRLPKAARKHFKDFAPESTPVS